MNSININIVENVLLKLHRDAKNDFMKIGKGMMKSIFRPIQPVDFEQAYLPISKEQGRSLQEIIIKNNCQNVIEFGTSFGISTIYLAYAVRKTGGKVVTTELLESKAKRAKNNINDAGLLDSVDIKVGDAMQTLQDYSQSIDFLFLDGWKDLYLPLFQMLAPKFHSGTLIYADNMDMAETKPYADFLSKNKSRYETKVVNHGKGFLTSIAKL